MASTLRLITSPHWQEMTRGVLLNLPSAQGFHEPWLYLTGTGIRARFLKNLYFEQKRSRSTLPQPPVLSWDAFLHRLATALPSSNNLLTSAQHTLFIWMAYQQSLPHLQVLRPSATSQWVERLRALFRAYRSWQASERFSQTRASQEPMLQDLNLLLENYHKLNGESWWDEEALLSYLTARSDFRWWQQAFPHTKMLYLEVREPLLPGVMDFLSAISRQGLTVTVLLHFEPEGECFSHLAPTYRQLREIASREERWPSELSSLSKYLFRPGKAQDLPVAPRILCGQEPREEARFAARFCKQLVLDQGVEPEQIVLTAPDLAAYLPLLEAEFQKVGMPLISRLPARAPQAMAIQHLSLFLEILREGEPLETVQQLLLSPYFSYHEPLSGVPVETVLRQAKVLTGLDPLVEQLQALKKLLAPDSAEESNLQTWLTILLAQLEQVKKDLQAFRSAETLAKWKKQLLMLLEKHRFGERIARAAEEELPGAVQDIWAVRAFFEQLDQCLALENGTAAFPGPDQEAWLPFWEWLIQNTALPEWPFHSKGVQAISFAALDAGECQYLLVLGMSEQNYPARPTTPIATLPEELKPFARQPTLSEAEQQFLLLLEHPSRALIFTYPRYVGENPQSPSTLLTELSRLGALKIEDVSLPDIPTEEEVLLARARYAGGPVPQPLLDHLAQHPHLQQRYQRLQWQKRVQTVIRREQQATPWEGNLEPVPLIAAYLNDRFEKHAFSVSALERYASCPMKFLWIDLLGLQEPQQQEEWLTPLEKGLYVHHVLYRFYTENQTKTLEELLRVAREEFEKLPLPRSRLWEVERERFLGSKEQPGLFQHFWAEEQRLESRWPSRPKYFELPFGQWSGQKKARFPRPVYFSRGEDGFYLKGVVDRVELSPDQGVIILDYKTGSNLPRLQEVLRGEALQLPLYLAAIVKCLQEKVPTAYALGAGFYSLSFQEARKKLLFCKNMADMDKALAEHILPDPKYFSAPLETLLDQVIQQTLEVVRRIRRGVFVHSPDPKRCLGGQQACPFLAICRPDWARLQGIQPSSENGKE